MQNIILKHKEDTGKTYRKMTEEINEILTELGEKPTLLKRSLIGYANGQNIPERAEITAGIAEYLNTTSALLLKNLKECKKWKT